MIGKKGAPINPFRKRLTLLNKIARLRLRMSDQEWRRYGAVLLTGKLAGVGLLLLGIGILFPELVGLKALVADPELKGNDNVISSIARPSGMVAERSAITLSPEPVTRMTVSETTS
jgi:hypothetical protein